MDWKEVAAVGSLGLGVITFLVGHWVRAFTYRREQRQREWERLSAILDTLENLEAKKGNWSQLAAAAEMVHLTKNRQVVRQLAREARDHWKGFDTVTGEQRGSDKHIAALDDTIVKLTRFGGIRRMLSRLPLLQFLDPR